MSTDPYAPIRSIDSSILEDIARRCLDRPDLHLIDWSAAPLAHAAVIETTGGLYLFRGRGWDGTQGEPVGSMLPWSAVLKIVTRPDEDCDDPAGLCYWRREALAYESGLLAGLPGSVRAPRCYGVTWHADREGPLAWIWLEYVPERDAPWDLAQYRRAARRLGALGAGYGSGRPVPDVPWLCRSFFRAMYAWDGWWARFIDPAALKNAWQRPLVREVFTGDLRERVLRIWAEKEQLLAALERLPRVLCHNDAHRGNLRWASAAEEGPAAPEGDTLVALDWGFCGPGALGSDLAMLIGGSLVTLPQDVADAAALEDAVLEGYIAGMRDAGWSTALREQQARLGYRLSLALYWGGTLAHEVAQAQPEDAVGLGGSRHGRPAGELLPGWKRLAAFALDRADQALKAVN